jgi:hypothetical protein
MLSQPEPPLVVFSNNLQAVLGLQHIVVFPEISRIQNLVASFCLSDGFFSIKAKVSNSENWASRHDT